MAMKRLLSTTLLLLLVGCGPREEAPGASDPQTSLGTRAAQNVTLPSARRGFATKLIRQESAQEPAPAPPARVFRKVHYEAPTGKMVAYLSPDPGDGKKHPAIIWI